MYDIVLSNLLCVNMHMCTNTSAIFFQLRTLIAKYQLCLPLQNTKADLLVQVAGASTLTSTESSYIKPR